MGLLSSLFGMFNERELVKLQKIAARNEEVRIRVAQALGELAPRIERARKLDEPERREALLALMNEATSRRHEALRAGATSYEDANWAAASAGETWLHTLLGGRPKGIARVETLIASLSSNG